MDFSIILATQNFMGLKKTLNAFERNTAFPHRLEVLLAVDTDEMAKKVESLQYSFSLKVYQVKPSDNMSDDYINFLAAKTRGKNIGVFNDDAWVMTEDWDIIVRKKIADSGWSVYLIDFFDTTRNHDGYAWPCFPMISRKAYNAMGFFFYPQIRMWPADQYIHGLFKVAERVINCHEVRIKHDYLPVSDRSKSRWWPVFQEDKKNNKDMTITREYIALLKAGQYDTGPRRSRIRKVLDAL